MSQDVYSSLTLLTPTLLKQTFALEFQKTSEVLGKSKTEEILFQGLEEILENFEDLRDIKLREKEESILWKL
jgi:hypothetical protein